MNEGIIQNSNFQVDTNIDNGRDGSFSSILKARDNTKSNASIQSENLHETATAMGKLNAVLVEFMKNLENTTTEVKKTQEFKEFNKLFKNFTTAFNDARVVVNKGSTDIETLAKNTEKCNNAYDAMGVAFKEMTSIYDAEHDQLKSLSKEKKKQLDLDKADLRLRQQIRQNQSKQIIADAKEGNKSAMKAFQQSADKLSKLFNISSIRRNLDDLTNSTGRSEAANIQLSMMNSLNLSKGEFNQFKRQIYSKIDKGLYSSKEVKQAIGSLETIGFTTKDEMVNMSSLVLRGQQLLGMSVDQQAKLQAIGNKTGQDYLNFTTNKMAKLYLENNSIGKKQLAELIDLNTNIVSQFSDIGISSEAFSNSFASATGALEALTGDSTLSNAYADVMKSAAQDDAVSALKFGMDLTDYQNALTNGQTATSMIMSGRGALGQLYNDLMGGMSNSDFQRTVSALGLSASDQTLLTRMTAYDKEHGRGAFENYIQSFTGTDNGEALSEVEKNTSEATSFLGKLTNNFTNWVAESFDWVDFSNFEQTMKIITTLLTIIAGSEIISNIGSLFKLGGKGVTSLGGKLAAGKLGSSGLGLISNTGAAGLSTAGKFLAGGSIAAGAIWAGVDAYKGFTETSKEMYGENATTGQKIGAGAASLASGSTVHRDKEGNVSVGKNVGMGALSGAGKGALIGAGIGSFIPGVGTVVGGAVGALVGGIAGAVGGWWKGKKAQEQEEREKAQLEEEKKIAENTAATKDLLAKTSNDVTVASRKTAGIRSYTGLGSTYHPSAKAISGGTGVGATYPWGINSGFGARTLPNGDQSGHNGVDWAVSEGTPIGAPINGTVAFAQSDSRNTYYNDYGLTYQQRLSAGGGVNITGTDGRTYQMWHLSKVGVKKGQTVKMGDTIGLSGNTGYSTGAHLHYGVKENGSWVDPISRNLVGAGLFMANGQMMIADANSDAIVDASSSPTQKVFNTKIRRYNTAGSGMGAVVDGLAAIKQTLIDLSNRQTQEEQILSMLQGSKKQDPRTA